MQQVAAKIAIEADNVAESQENFFVELSHPNNATIADESGTVTINDVAFRNGEVLAPQFSATAIPNPSAGDFLISVTGAGGAMMKVEVYDAIGRRVKTYTVVDGFSVRIGRDLGPGVYTVKVMQGDNAAVLRVVKV